MDFMWTVWTAEHAGVAKRRRERRLRAYLRCARMSVAMAESNHHAAHGDRTWPGPERRGTRRSTTRHGDRGPLLPSVPVLTPGRELVTTRSAPPRSSSHRSTFHNASWSSPSIHPFRKLWKGTWNLSIWSLACRRQVAADRQVCSCCCLCSACYSAGRHLRITSSSDRVCVIILCAFSRECIRGSSTRCHLRIASSCDRECVVTFTCHGLCRTHSSDRFRGSSTCLLVRITSSRDHICRFPCGTRSCDRSCGAHTRRLQYCEKSCDRVCGIRACRHQDGACSCEQKTCLHHLLSPMQQQFH